MRVCAVVTESTTAHARALAEDLQRHHPGTRLEVLAVGAGVGSAESFRSVDHRVLPIDIGALIALHAWPDVELLARAVLLRHVAASADEPVLLLAPTTEVHAALTPFLDAVGRRSVTLTPRMPGAVPDDGCRPSQDDLLAAGRYSDAVLGVQPGPEAIQLLNWWTDGLQRTLENLTAADGSDSSTRPAPRLNRWLDLAGARFPAAIEVVPDPAACLSAWNLHECRLGLDGSQLIADGRVASTIDFVGFDPSMPHWLSADADRVRVPGAPALAAICRRRAERLVEHGWRGNGGLPQGGALADGTPVDEGLARRYAEARLQNADFGDLASAEGTERFLAWLAEPAPRGAAAGLNRYLLGIWRDRRDLRAAYPTLDGDDGEGYAGWAWIFGRDEMGIPDRLLPPLPAHVPPDHVGPREETERIAAEAVDDVPVVNVAGFLGGALGLGAAARAYVTALSAAGVQVTTTTVQLPSSANTDGPASDYARVEFDERAHADPPGVNLVCVNADELPAFAELLGAEFWAGRRTIGVWAWETDHIPDRWERSYRYVDEIWTYTSYVGQNIGRVAPVPVVSIPIPVVAPRPAPDPLAGELPDGFRFLFVFDLFSTLQRKNPIGLIDAFTRAFAPGEGPHLVVKTLHAPVRPKDFDELRYAAGDREDIFVVDRSLSATERDGLMASCDCYVSLHRSEGFGLTLAECMAVGKPVIGTAYSGNVDFMTPANSYLVEWTPAQVGPRGEHYPADGWWAEPDLDHAARLMREVWEHPERARQRGERARLDIARALSPEAVGALVRARLLRLARVGTAPVT